MRTLIAIAVLALMPATAPADDKTPIGKIPAGTFLGHDGKAWKMEGCAAYPVEPQAGAQSSPVAAASEPPPDRKLAQSKPARAR